MYILQTIVDPEQYLSNR